MFKDRARYADTKGWGFARWRGPELNPYGKDAGFAAENRAATARFLALLAELERSLSPAQRRHAVQRLAGFARDFQVLADAR